MPATFTSVNTFECSERDWAMNLGMLDWDDTRIVFTKRELLNFLKYIGTSVDPNFNNISKLPRYVTFGKLEGDPSPGGAGASGDASASAATGGDFVPTRRVREAPGGRSTFALGIDSEDALAAAPPKEAPAPKKTDTAEEETQGLPAPNLVPTRRVRDPPGGKDSLSSFWDPAPEDEFRPTRRVRDQPGGKDNISNIF